VEIYCKEKRYSEAEKLVLKDIKNANDIDKSNAQDDIVPPTFSRAAPFFALLGDVYLDEGKPSEAEQCYKSALRGDTTLQRAATGLARVADLEHLPDSARIWRERAKSAPSYNWEMTMTLDEHI
jgi:tetratricopeptide (TPR) repeat protein